MALDGVGLVSLDDLRGPYAWSKRHLDEVIDSLGPDVASQMAQQPDPAPTPEEATQQQAEVGRVRAAIEAIPEPFREAVVLRDLEDMSYAEIAQATGVPVGTVMSRLSRGRAMLAAELLPARSEDSEQSRSAK